MKTKVVNIKQERYDVYIGRGSPFGNPYKIGIEGTREQVIEKYKVWFYEQLEKDLRFVQQVLQLEEKRLGCFCFPLACHGNIIVEFIHEYKKSSNK